MSHATIINGPASRARAHKQVAEAPIGTVVELREDTRSLEQNNKMWPMLTEVSEQATLRNQQWTPEQWKAIFLQELGHQVDVLPTLDGKSWFPCSHQSSKLSKAQMSELIELIYAEGTQRGVVFKNDTKETPSETVRSR